MENSRIPNKLLEYRRLYQFLQKDVIELIQLGDSCTLSRWEKGICFPSTLHLIALCCLYSTSVEQLYPEVWKQMDNELKDKKNTMT